MYMVMIMTMNIYISKDNEKWLRMQNTSMSGIINRLLDEARAGKHGLHVIAQFDTLEEAQVSHNIRPDIQKISPVATPQIIKESTPVGPNIFIEAGKPDSHLPLKCCTAKKPCKHWEYDGGKGIWVNTISGEEREVAQ